MIGIASERTGFLMDLNKKFAFTLMYKVVELNIVTDETIQNALNTWTQQGWTFESLHFAMGTSSKRPSMAFLFFVRSREDASVAGETRGKEGDL